MVAIKALHDDWKNSFFLNFSFSEIKPYLKHVKNVIINCTDTEHFELIRNAHTLKHKIGEFFIESSKFPDQLVSNTFSFENGKLLEKDINDSVLEENVINFHKTNNNIYDISPLKNCI